MLYYAQGTAFITEDELFEKKTISRVSDFYTELNAGQKPTAISFSTGKLDRENAILAWNEAPGAQLVPFKPIGLGLPLNIMIREVYTGKYPSGLFKGIKKDLLVTSAIKSITTFDAKPRALNILKDKVSANFHIQGGPACQEGTPFIFYSPALIEKALTLDLTLILDQFNQELFSTIGNVLQSAAGIPIFLSKSVYLLAGGALAKLVGAGGEALFDGKPFFDSSEMINIDIPGTPALPPGFALITDGNVDKNDPEFRRTYQIDSYGRVVDGTGNTYNGDIPYIVISIDGTLWEELAAFTPTAACAALLSRFFGIKENQQQPLDTLLDAVKLYNDFTYRQEVDRLDKQIEGLPEGEEKVNLKKKREALSKNILNDLLKKP
jgi:hypothetical protein